MVNNQQELSVTENSSPFNSSEAIAGLAKYLEACETAEDLAELQQATAVFTSD